MRIDQLLVRNFKKFEEQTFDLHPQFTLLVGDNGSGKTSVLDALAVSLGIWLEFVPDTILLNSRRNILPKEIRLEAEPIGNRVRFRECKPVQVQAAGWIGGQNVTWMRQIREGGARTTNADAQKALDIIRDLYERDKEGKRLLFPVLAYYGAGRAWLPSNKRIQGKSGIKGPARRWAAFYDCLNERIRIAELRDWFRRETTAAGNRGGRMWPGFEVVRRSILGCVPDADAVWFDSDRDQIVLSIGGNAQPFDNLSAGQQMMLAMVADIAIKAVTQNMHLLPPDELGPEDEPLSRLLTQTPGVVLIDELEVHLHPKWQRRVASDLKRTFPAIQFVCTSHSPQVIGELLPEEIRILDCPGHPIPDQSFGMDSNWIVEVLMKGADRNSEVDADINRLFRQIMEKDLGGAEQLLAQIRSETGDTEDLMRAAATIQRIRLLGK